MNITKSLLIGIIVTSLNFAQTTITISGKVMEAGRTPIAGATIKLEKVALTTVSGTDGSFLLTGAIGINSPINKPLSNKISVTIHNDVLLVVAQERSVVSVLTYTVQGKTISSIHKTIDIGTNPVAQLHKSAGVYLYRIQSGKNEIVIKSTSTRFLSNGTSSLLQNLADNSFVRYEKGYVPINDTIKVTKDGYLSCRVNITNSDTSGIEIKLVKNYVDTVVDIEGNVYHTVKIGNQLWTIENLQTTKYNDSSDIPLVTDDKLWEDLKTPAYCLYNNTGSIEEIKKYGLLYNWYAVDIKKLAPNGWHVPDTADWNILENYLIANGHNWDGTMMGNKIAKSLAAKTDWSTYTAPGTIGCDLSKNNRSGFSALPGGFRYDDGSFDNKYYYGYWWSATGSSLTGAHSRRLVFGEDYLGSKLDPLSPGYSIKLVRYIY